MSPERRAEVALAGLLAGLLLASGCGVARPSARPKPEKASDPAGLIVDSTFEDHLLVTLAPPTLATFRAAGAAGFALYLRGEAGSFCVGATLHQPGPCTIMHDLEATVDVTADAVIAAVGGPSDVVVELQAVAMRRPCEPTSQAPTGETCAEHGAEAFDAPRSPVHTVNGLALPAVAAWRHGLDGFDVLAIERACYSFDLEERQRCLSGSGAEFVDVPSSLFEFRPPLGRNRVPLRGLECEYVDAQAVGPLTFVTFGQATALKSIEADGATIVLTFAKPGWPEQGAGAERCSELGDPRGLLAGRVVTAYLAVDGQDAGLPRVYYNTDAEGTIHIELDDFEPYLRGLLVSLISTWDQPIIDVDAALELTWINAVSGPQQRSFPLAATKLYAQVLTETYEPHLKEAETHAHEALEACAKAGPEELAAVMKAHAGLERLVERLHRFPTLVQSIDTLACLDRYNAEAARRREGRRR